MNKLNLVEKLDKKIYRAYKKILEAYILDIDLSLSFSIPRISMKYNKLEIDNEYRKLINIEKNNNWIEIIKEKTQKWTIAKSLDFNSSNSYISYIWKIQDYKKFQENIDIILWNYKELEEWILKNIWQINFNDGKWSHLILIVDYFLKNPSSNLFLRELPIKIHSKFIERNKKIIDSLLSFLWPIKDLKFRIESSVFEFKYGLKTKPNFVRFRFLDKNLQREFYSVDIDDISLKLEDFSKLNLWKIQVFITENEINYLTLPNIKNSIVIWGAGFKVTWLKNINWLKNNKIYYWWDIDVHGFEILIRWKQIFPYLQSIMMDKETYDRFDRYKVIGEVVTRNRLDSFIWNLDEEQQKLCKYLNDNSLRLEQESIDFDYVKKILWNLV